MEVIIQGAISALGFIDDDGKYCPEPDCYETLRDLIRYLRTDSNTYIARRLIGERNVVENDLIPLLKSKKEDEQMFDIILRLMVNLMQPTMVTFMGKQPEGLDQTKICSQLENNLRKTKLAFADSGLFSILKDKLKKYFIDTEWDDRTEEDRLVVERIIVLIRYTLSISSSMHDEKRTALESNSHDRLILSFLDSGLQDIFLNIASDTQEKDFHLSVLEIFAYIVKEHNPDDIVSAAQGRDSKQKESAEIELRQIFEREQNKLSEMKKKMLAGRHSRFAGTYWVDGLHSMNKENKFFTAKPVMDVNKVSFLDERKKKVRIAKNRRICNGNENVHLSSLELRLRLKELLEQVLLKGFNRLMRNTKNQALESHRSLAQKNADIHYLLVMRFFLRFCRLSKMDSSTIESCLGVEMFHMLQLKIDQYLENATLQKTEARSQGIRAQFAVTAYKELILFTQHMIDFGNTMDKESANATCNHILNVEEYRELSISTLRKLQPAAISKTFLRELVLATHYYFKMLEKSVKNGALRSVLKRQKKKKARKAPKKMPSDNNLDRPVCDSWTDERLDFIWAKICGELSDVMMGHTEASIDQLAINSMLSASDEEHQQFAMLRIQRLLRGRNVCDSVGLYRACRDIWYIDDIFGTNDMDPEEEFNELRTIFFTDLNEIAAKMLKVEEAAEKRFAETETYANYSSEESDESDYENKEVEFNFDVYVKKFSASDIIKWYLYLLADFEKNTVELNKALVKMLHRIAFDLKSHSKLFQLSLFRILQRVNEKIVALDPAERKTNQFYELYTFGYHLLKSTHKDTDAGWPEELEDELRSLHNEWRNMDERPEGMDLLDYIEGNLSRERTRAQLQKKLKNLGLDTFGAKRTKGIDKGFPLITMKKLVEEFNSKDDKNQLDLVDWLITSMKNEKAGMFSRQKIIKQLSYAGVVYVKKKAKRSVPKKKLANDDFIHETIEEKSLSELSDIDDNVESLFLSNQAHDDVGRYVENRSGANSETQPLTSTENINYVEKRKAIIDSDGEDDVFLKSILYRKKNMTRQRTESPIKETSITTVDEPTRSNLSRKRQRIVSSDESEDDNDAPGLTEQTAAQSPSRKGRRVFIDSDEDD